MTLTFGAKDEIEIAINHNEALVGRLSDQYRPETAKPSSASPHALLNLVQKSEFPVPGYDWSKSRRNGITLR